MQNQAKTLFSKIKDIYNAIPYLPFFIENTSDFNKRKGFFVGSTIASLAMLALKAPFPSLAVLTFFTIPTIFKAYKNLNLLNTLNTHPLWQAIQANPIYRVQDNLSFEITPLSSFEEKNALALNVAEFNSLWQKITPTDIPLQAYLQSLKEDPKYNNITQGNYTLVLTKSKVDRTFQVPNSTLIFKYLPTCIVSKIGEEVHLYVKKQDYELITEKSKMELFYKLEDMLIEVSNQKKNEDYYAQKYNQLKDIAKTIEDSKPLQQVVDKITKKSIIECSDFFVQQKLKQLNKLTLSDSDIISLNTVINELNTQIQQDVLDVSLRDNFIEVIKQITNHYHVKEDNRKTKEELMYLKERFQPRFAYLTKNSSFQRNKIKRVIK